MGESEKIYDNLSDQAVINFLLISVAGMGLVIGMSFPLVTLNLERMEFGSTLIGLNSAAGSFGILCVGMFTGHLLVRHGALPMMIAACLLTVATLLMMPMTESVAGWFVLRFLEALGLGFLWLITEAWLNALAGDEKRGRVMGLYGMAFSGGFASGPLLVSVIGSQGMLPFAITAAIAAIASLPMILLAGTHKAVEEEEAKGHLKIFRLGLFVFFVAFAAGGFESAVFALIPVYTLSEGLSESLTLYALSALSAGGIVMQYPMGRLADTFGRYALMVAITIGTLLSVLAIPYAIHTLLPLLGVFFIFGGSIFGLYTLGLILMGDRFGVESLVVANAVFIIAYEAGGIAAPSVAGVAMDIWPQSGFIGTLVVFAVLLAGVTIIRRNR